MNQFSTEYLVPDGTRSDDIKALITGQRRIAEDPERSLQRTFYDTFDWALYLAGSALEMRQGGAHSQLLLHDLRGREAGLSLDFDGQPGFAWDLPEGALRDSVEPLLTMRRLLPIITVESRIQTLRILNDDEKTIARLIIEGNRYRGDSARGREGNLAARLRLEPVRGYDKELHQTSDLLHRDIGLEEAKTPLMLEALAAAGRRPGEYSSRLDYRLDPKQRADAATKEILLGLLDTIEANVAGTQANLDSEFLHDLRVACRRTRSALTQIKDVFPPDVVEEYKERFAWMQQITGPVRDLDVYLLDFDAYQQSLPEPMRAGLTAFKDFLLAHYDGEQARLAKELSSNRFGSLIKDWLGFLEAPVPERSAVPNAMRPIKAVADERIWRMFRRVVKEGRSITADSPAEDLHELRKSCKKLRYLTEFFQSIYPKDEMKDLIKQLKVLLDNLGGFQDLAVQADHLREIAERMRAEAHVKTDSLLSMGALIGDLLLRQHLAREEFAKIFGQFDKKPNRERFNALFAPEDKRSRGA